MKVTLPAILLLPFLLPAQLWAGSVFSQCYSPGQTLSSVPYYANYGRTERTDLCNQKDLRMRQALRRQAEVAALNADLDAELDAELGAINSFEDLSVFLSYVQSQSRPPSRSLNDYQDENKTSPITRNSPSPLNHSETVLFMVAALNLQKNVGISPTLGCLQEGVAGQGEQEDGILYD